MTTKYWIKFYHEVLDDPKMGRLPDNLWRRFYECCLLAGEAGYDDGDENNGRLPSLQDISWRLRVDIETLRQEFDDMARRGLIEYRSPSPLDGYWFITNFDKRQKKMDKSEYMRRLRRERAGQLPDSYQSSYQSVTNGHADKEEDKIKRRGEERYIHPDPDPISKIKTEISKISSTAYWAKTENEYDSAAYALIGWDATPEEVSGFGEWWAKNGWHTDRPVLTNILDHWQDFKDGKCLRKQSPNGNEPTQPEVVEVAVFPEDY